METTGPYSSSSDEERDAGELEREAPRVDPSQGEGESQASESPANHGSEKNMGDVEQTDDDGSVKSMPLVPMEWRTSDEEEALRPEETKSASLRKIDWHTSDEEEALRTEATRGKDSQGTGNTAGGTAGGPPRRRCRSKTGLGSAAGQPASPDRKQTTRKHMDVTPDRWKRSESCTRVQGWG